MKRRSEKTGRQERFGPRRIFFAGTVIVLAVVTAGTATAASKGASDKTKLTGRAATAQLDSSITLTPPWIFSSPVVLPTARTATQATLARPTVPVTIAAVYVPPRPLPRSPFMPPGRPG